MNSYEIYTAKLDRQANRPKKVLRVLKRYKELGEEKFLEDLDDFLHLDIDSFQDKEDKQRLRNVLLDIRHDIDEYNKCRDQVNGAIREIESHPKLQVNHFARNLHVNVLRGDGFFERYEEDVYYALQELSVPQ